MILSFLKMSLLQDDKHFPNQKYYSFLDSLLYTQKNLLKKPLLHLHNSSTNENLPKSLLKQITFSKKFLSQS